MVARGRFAGHHQSARHRGNRAPPRRIDRHRLGGTQHDRAGKIGFKPDNLQIIVELKSGEKLSVDFGAPISNQTALAAVTLDGERWAFVFPPVLYQLVVTYLTIPANIP